METFIHTIHLLQRLSDVPQLPVADLVGRLLETEGGSSQPSAVVGPRHIVSWGFEDLISASSDNSTAEIISDKESNKGLHIHALSV